MPNFSIEPGKKTDHRVPPIPAPMKAMMNQGKSYIYNVGPWQHSVSMGSLGTFIIPACPDGEEVSPPLRFRGEDGIPSIVPETVVDSVEGYAVTYKWEFATEGARLAKNIIGLTGFAHASADLTQFGVFLSAGAVPTAEEIAAANENLETLLDKRVREADQKFEVNGGMEQGENGVSYPGITQDHVFACKRLGLDRPWARKNSKQVPCEACGQPVSPVAVRCHHTGCGAILNEEKARKLFPHLYAHEEPKRGPGRPRAEQAA
jgi:hypothetical protein